MRLVLLGDLHFYQLGVWPWQLLSKRSLGQANLWLNRRRYFRISLWPEIGEKIQTLAPDALLSSGDFTTTALRAEFRQASAAWQSLAESLELTWEARVVPGNHDRYCFSSHRQRLFEKAFGPWTSESWPAVWPFGDAACVIGLDPTRPNFFNASGVLGELQLQALGDAIAGVPPEAALLVLCHYPIGTPPGVPVEAPGHGLRDQARLVEVLAGSERPITYLHGHIHRPWVWTLPGAPNVTAVNAGAPMLTGRRYPRGQGFVELTLEAGRVGVRRHCMDAQGAWVSEDETP